MSVYKMFKGDEALETKGIVLDYGDFKITVARAGGANKHYTKVAEEKFRPHRRAMEAGLLTEDIGRKVLADIYAESVILGWEGVTDEDGKPLEFSKENVKKLLFDLPDLFADIREQAGKLSLFRRELSETAVKN